MKKITPDEVREKTFICDNPNAIFFVKKIVKDKYQRYAVATGFGDLRDYIPCNDGDFIFALPQGVGKVVYEMEEHEALCLN